MNEQNVQSAVRILNSFKKYLNRIQVYKSTADYDAAKEMYVDGYSNVSDEFLEMRTVVLEKKKERQPITDKKTI